MDIITEHDVIIKHIEGKHNFVADLLSRCEYQSINSIDDIVKSVHEEVVGHGSFDVTNHSTKNSKGVPSLFKTQTFSKQNQQQQNRSKSYYGSYSYGYFSLE